MHVEKAERITKNDLGYWSLRFGLRPMGIEICCSSGPQINATRFFTRVSTYCRQIDAVTVKLEKHWWRVHGRAVIDQSRVARGVARRCAWRGRLQDRVGMKARATRATDHHRPPYAPDSSVRVPSRPVHHRCGHTYIETDGWTLT